MSIHISAIKADLHSKIGTLHTKVQVYNDDGGISQVYVDAAFAHGTSVIVYKNGSRLCVIMAPGNRTTSGLEHLFDEQGEFKRMGEKVEIIYKKLTTD